MRCFLGIPVPGDCRSALKGLWQPTDKDRSVLRLADPGQWHITLAFFGNVEYDNLLRLKEFIGRALETPPSGAFKISKIESFPSKKPVYIVAKCEPEQEEAWRECVLQVTDMASLFAPQTDRNPWIPHITLARTRNNKELEHMQIQVNDLGWVPRNATLYKSDHTPTGPIYTPLHEFPINI